jgi:hypothetical protein
LRKHIPAWLAAEPLKHAPRLALKGGFLLLGLYALLEVSWPTQAKSWGLWITDQGLASATALLLTLAAAGIIGVSNAASQAGRWFTGLAGLSLAVGIYVLTLGAAWNFYLHESTKNGTAVLEASQRVASASTTRIEELQKELKALDEREQATIAPLDARIATLPPGPTLRQVSASKDSALVRFADQRKPLQDELAELRRRDTQIDNRSGIVNTTPVDSRPLDVELALFLGVPRTAVGSVLDLVRSAVVEAFLVLFLPLVLSDRPIPRADRPRRWGVIMDAWLDYVAATVRAKIPTPATPTAPPAPAPEPVDAPEALYALLAELGAALLVSTPPGAPPIDAPPPTDPDSPAKPDPAPKRNKGLPVPTESEIAAARARAAKKEFA